MTHSIFYDATCPLCQKMIGQIKERDEKGIFRFLPLEGDEAKEKLPAKLLKGDTVVLVEESGKMWVRAQACFRILHLLGNRSLGLLAYVTPLNLFYRIIAHNRHIFR